MCVCVCVGGGMCACARVCVHPLARLSVHPSPLLVYFLETLKCVVGMGDQAIHMCE